MQICAFVTPQDRMLVQSRVNAILAAGGALVVPTDTAYGLAADATQPAAIARVHAIKGSAPTKPMHVIVADLAMAERYVVISPLARALCDHFLPGPVTFLLPSKGLLPHDLTVDSSVVGIRIPVAPLLCELVSAYGRPLTATSANRAGNPTLYRPRDIEVEFSGSADRAPAALLDAGDLPSDIMPSTMVALDAHDQLTLVRSGPVPFEKIQEVMTRIQKN